MIHYFQFEEPGLWISFLIGCAVGIPLGLLTCWALKRWRGEASIMGFRKRRRQ